MLVEALLVIKFTFSQLFLHMSLGPSSDVPSSGRSDPGSPRVILAPWWVKVWTSTYHLSGATNLYVMNGIGVFVCFFVFNFMIRMVSMIYYCTHAWCVENQQIIKYGRYPQCPFSWVGLRWFLVCNSLPRKMKLEVIDLSCWLFPAGIMTRNAWSLFEGSAKT